MTDAKPKERKTCNYCPMAGPRCEYHYCGKPADWSVMAPTWRKTAPFFAPKFFCSSCREYFKAAMAKPLKGIDRPADAPEDWHPSLMEHLRWGRIELEHQRRLERDRAARDDGGNVVVQDWEIKMFGWSPAQIETVKQLRHLTRKFAAR